MKNMFNHGYEPQSSPDIFSRDGNKIGIGAEPQGIKPSDSSFLASGFKNLTLVPRVDFCNKKIQLFTIAFFALLAMNACMDGAKKIEEPSANNVDENVVTITNAQRKNANIELGNIEERQISASIRVNGQIDVPPQNLVSITTTLGGYLKSTKLLPGMHVSKGEAIAVIEDQQFIQIQQEYLTTKARVHYAEKDYNRQKDLNASKASSDRVFQQAQMEYNTQRVNLNALAEKLRLININPNQLTERNITRSINMYSPINGYVSKVNVNIGRYVTAADVLFELINPSDIHLNLKIFEKDLNKLFIGQRVMAYTNNAPNVKYPCSIILISRDLSADHTADVHCHFDNFDPNLSPGMYMNAELEVSNKRNSSLPEDAIVTFEGKDFVFVVDKENTYRITQITAGNTENGFVEVKNLDVLKGKQIVTKGAYALLMKMKNTEE
ncbi:MAG: efflux RND transporter periplasmic adaptor subunit [Chitinophagaceae bacterium]|nr:efflux RND transporter periplasmic adaptor subunit [Chitinophagaceae bacterium]